MQRMTRQQEIREKMIAAMKQKQKEREHEHYRNERVWRKERQSKVEPSSVEEKEFGRKAVAPDTLSVVVAAAVLVSLPSVLLSLSSFFQSCL